ncbi:CRP1 [Symbiodinium natans]|uniref:CRP1 protein n=1 Tax=Symbiodinium natans TaxID=878477 RepID=A0A812II17_9DINO|nr:CRP1 [Symbiodinium natans]
MQTWGWRGGSRRLGSFHMAGGHWEKSLRLLEDARSLQMRPDGIAYSAAIGACQVGIQWAQAVWLLKKMQEDGIVPDENTMISAILSCRECEQLQAAEELQRQLDDFRRSERRPGARDGAKKGAYTCPGLAMELARTGVGLCTGSWLKAVEAVGDDVKTYADTNRSSRNLQWQQSLHAVAVVSFGSTPAVWTSLLSSCARQASWQAALMLLNQHPGIQSSQIFFNVAASACGGEAWTCSLSVIRDMRVRRFEADHFSYGASIAACTPVWNTALAALKTAEIQGVETNVIMAGAAIAGHEMPWSCGLELLSCQQRNLQRTNAISFNAAASSCERSSDWEAALSLVSRAGMPDETSWGILLSVLARSNRWQEALQCLRSIRLQALRANSIHATSALAATVSCKDGWKHALSLLHQVSMLGLQQNSFILSAAVSACDSHARWEQAACVLRTAVQEGLHVNPVVYNSVVSACASGIQWSGALHVLNSVQQAASLQAALQAGSNAAVEALGRSLLWPRALRCLRCLRLARQEANIVGQSSAITGCARAAAWACGLLLWQAMQAASAARFSDTSPTLNAVVTAASQGVWQLAVSFLQSPGDVREPLADAPTYGAALRACVGDAGAGDVALSLFERMRVQQVDPDEAAWSAVIAAARDDLQALAGLTVDLRRATLGRMREL